MAPAKDDAPAGGPMRQGLRDCANQEYSAIVNPIVDAHLAARTAAETAVSYALKAGALLVAAKAQIPHGEFGAFLAALPFAERTARAYMRLANADPAKRQRVADMSLRSALTEVAAPKPPGTT